jgi:hypothetical protein
VHLGIIRAHPGKGDRNLSGRVRGGGELLDNGLVTARGLLLLSLLPAMRFTASTQAMTPRVLDVALIGDDLSQHELPRESRPSQATGWQSQHRQEAQQWVRGAWLRDVPRNKLELWTERS